MKQPLRLFRKTGSNEGASQAILINPIVKTFILSFSGVKLKMSSVTMDNLHNRLKVELGRKNEIFYNS